VCKTQSLALSVLIATTIAMAAAAADRPTVQ